MNRLLLALICAVAMTGSACAAGDVYAGLGIDSETTRADINSTYAMISAGLDDIEINEAAVEGAGSLHFTCAQGGAAISLQVPQIADVWGVKGNGEFKTEVRLMGNGGIDDYGLHEAVVGNSAGELSLDITMLGIGADVMNSLASGGNLWVRRAKSPNLGSLHITVFSPVHTSDYFISNAGHIAAACNLY